MASTSSSLSAFGEDPEEHISARIAFLNSSLPQVDRVHLARIAPGGLFAACASRPNSIKQRIGKLIQDIGDDASRITDLFQIVPDSLALPISIASVPVDGDWLTGQVEAHEEALDVARKSCVYNPKDKACRHLLDVATQMWWSLTYQLSSDLQRAPLAERVFSELAAFLQTLAGNRYELLVLAAQHIALDVCELLCVRRVQIAVAGGSGGLLQLIDALVVRSDADAICRRAYASKTFDALLVRFAAAMRVCIPSHDAHFGNEKNMGLLRALLEVQLPKATLAALDVCASLQKPGLQYLAASTEGARLMAAIPICALAKDDAVALRALAIVAQLGQLPSDLIRRVCERFAHVAAAQQDDAGPWGAMVATVVAAMGVRDQYMAVFHVVDVFARHTAHSSAGPAVAIRYLRPLTALEARSLLHQLMHGDAFDAHQMALLGALLYRSVAGATPPSHAFADDLLTKCADVAERMRNNAAAIYWLFRTFSLLVRQDAAQLRAKIENGVELALEVLTPADLQMAAAWPAIIQAVVDAERALQTQTMRTRIHCVYERIAVGYQTAVSAWHAGRSADSAQMALAAVTKVRHFLQRGVHVDALAGCTFMCPWTDSEMPEEVIEGQIACYGYKLVIEALRDADALTVRPLEFWSALDALFVAKPGLQVQICDAMGVYAGLFERIHADLEPQVARAIMPPYWRCWRSKMGVREVILDACFGEAAPQVSLAKRQSLLHAAFRLFWRSADCMAMFVRHAVRTFAIYGAVFERELRAYARCNQRYSDLVLATLLLAAADAISALCELLMAFMAPPERAAFQRRVADDPDDIHEMARVKETVRASFNFNKTIANLKKRSQLGTILDTVVADFAKKI